MLLLSFYQMCILLQYSGGVLTLSFDELERKTGISTQELKRHIHGLCNPKLPLMQKVTKDDSTPVSLRSS